MGKEIIYIYKRTLGALLERGNHVIRGSLSSMVLTGIGSDALGFRSE
jgi:hypothetical protein